MFPIFFHIPATHFLFLVAPSPISANTSRVQLVLATFFSQLPLSARLAYAILVAPSPGVQLPLSLDAQTQVFLGAEVQLPFGA